MQLKWWVWVMMLTAATAAATSRDKYGLPVDYVQRTTTDHYNDAAEDPIKARWYQREVYRHAMNKLLDNHTFMPPPREQGTVVDMGAGAGYKLVELLGHHDTYGIEVEPALSVLRQRYPDRKWIDGGSPDGEKEGGLSYDRISKQLPEKIDVLICSDVVEHFRDPDELLRFLKLFNYRRLIISTPDRAVLWKMEGYGEASWKGPPSNPTHYREWTSEEFIWYLTHQHGFKIESSHLGTNQIECQWHVLLPYEPLVVVVAASQGYHMLGEELIPIE